MTDPKDNTPWMLRAEDDFLVNKESPHFSEFQEVSENFTRGYKRFLDLGFPSETIGLAMVNATINIYTMLNMRQDLPKLFRDLAEKIEHEENLH